MYLSLSLLQDANELHEELNAWINPDVAYVQKYLFLKTINSWKSYFVT